MQRPIGRALSDFRPAGGFPAPTVAPWLATFTVTASGGIVLGGMATVGVAYGVVTQGGLLLQAVIVPGKNTSDGRMIEERAPACVSSGQEVSHYSSAS